MESKNRKCFFNGQKKYVKVSVMLSKSSKKFKKNWFFSEPVSNFKKIIAAPHWDVILVVEYSKTMNPQKIKYWLNHNDIWFFFVVIDIVMESGWDKCPKHLWLF